ncbi:MAG: nucleotidyltransferase family protein [Desulfurococcales archaeon]|nr:nucleotidyltransferase family protein [Desulfurococcales archaeon]
MPRIASAILAGGEGKRFRPYTDLIPKPMIPVGPEEKPLVEYIIRWISRYGIEDFILLVGYRWRQLANYLGDGSRLGVRIVYSIDGGGFKGTGGALLKAWREGLLSGYDVAVVWYGDIISMVDVGDLVRTHTGCNAQATVVVTERYQVPVGIARVDEQGYISELHEKPWLNVKATIGVMALQPSILDGLEDSLGTGFDIMGDLIPWMIAGEKRVKAYIYKGPWYDVGSLERYEKLETSMFREFLSSS